MVILPLLKKGVMDHLFSHLWMSSTTLAARLEKMKPASPMDPELFMGRWYDIEAFPTTYDKGCTDMEVSTVKTCPNH